MHKGAADMISLTNKTKLYGNLMQQKPAATAKVRGTPENPETRGTVYFFNTYGGVVVSAEFTGLPQSFTACEQKILAFHIHEGKSCTGTPEDPFKDAGGHYNPGGCAHPNHAGDMPPLFAGTGRAFLAFFTDRFTVDEIIGRTVVVHAKPDDFTTQPSGNSGAKIACGQIRKA
jgi:Cu-Zn family superoxide dismutase